MTLSSLYNRNALAVLENLDTLPPVSQVAFAVAAQVMTWETRYRTRKSLRGLEKHQLKDIGISRAEALDEADRPFWRG